MNKTVLFIITKTEIGGAQTWTKNVASVFKHNLHCKAYLVSSESGWLSEQSEFERAFIIPQIKKLFGVASIYKIAKILSEVHPDLVICSSANAGIYARIAAFLTGTKNVYYVSHGWSCFYNGKVLRSLFCFVERVTSYLPAKIICVSKEDYIKAKDVLKINERKLCLIPNRCAGIGTYNTTIKIDKKIKAICVCRLAPPKRVDLLIRALNNVDYIELTVVGNGPLYNGLRNDLGVSKNIRFVGEIPFFKDFYKFDIFILASDSEGLPMSAIEAAEQGLPLLLSNVGGCSELLINNNGFVFENNLESIRSSLSKIVSDYESIKRNAIECRSYFDINHDVLKYKKLFKGGV
ncbi:glycosyltransferase [Aeromonas veronii]